MNGFQSLGVDAVVRDIPRGDPETPTLGLKDFTQGNGAAFIFGMTTTYACECQDILCILDSL